MQFQNQRNYPQKPQKQNRNYLAPTYQKQNFNNSLSIHDSRQFQFFDYDQHHQIPSHYDMNKISFVQSPINKIKSQISIKDNFNPHYEKDNEQDQQVHQLANILNNQQKHRMKNLIISCNNNSSAKKDININKFQPQEQFWSKSRNQIDYQQKIMNINTKNIPQRPERQREITKNKKYEEDQDIQYKYKTLKNDYEKLEYQYTKLKGQNQHLRTQKSNLMNQNIQSTKKLNHNYQMKMAELNQTIQQLQAKVYQLQMGDLININNSRTFTGQQNSQTGRNSIRQKHQNGVLTVNTFYLQELQRSNQHLKCQNKRLNQVLMHKVRNSFKNMY